MTWVDIGSPPEFGRDGSPPPVESVPVEIARWNLNSSVSQVIRIDYKYDGPPLITLRDYFHIGWRSRRALERKAATFEGWESSRNKAMEMAVKGLLQEQGIVNLDWREVRLWPAWAIYDYFWRREDPTTQLPPGGTSEIALRLKVGMSEEHADEFAQSLGIAGEGSHLPGLSAQLSIKSSTKVALSLEKEIDRKITLSNPSDSKYRRLAIWHAVHRLSIVALPESPLRKSLVCQMTEFTLSEATNVTSMDVARP